LLYYHHHFSGSVRGPAQYTLFDLSGGSVTTTDFSGGNWNNEENGCVFTKKGNLLSMFYRELYDGRTGALIANVSSTVPSMTTAGSIMGWRINGEYYFADDVAGTNFRRFIEPGSIGHDLNNDGKPDLLWRNPVTGVNVVYYMDGVTILSGVYLPTIGPEWTLAGR
jgi:hypothetical protein